MNSNISINFGDSIKYITVPFTVDYGNLKLSFICDSIKKRLINSWKASTMEHQHSPIEDDILVGNLDENNVDGITVLSHAPLTVFFGNK